MLLSACSAGVGDESFDENIDESELGSIDESIDESELGSVQQAYYDLGKGRLSSYYWSSNYRCVDAPYGYWGNMYSGARLQQWECHFGQNQYFYQIMNDDGSRTFQHAMNRNLCLDVVGGATHNGAPVQLYQCNGTRAQKFWSTDWGYQSKGTNKCLDLDISGSYGDRHNGPNGSKLQLWDCAGTDNQRFYFDRH
jgi:hypothetical protein